MKKLLDELPKKYEFNSSENLIGEGFEAKVYRLNKDLAVKIPIDHCSENISFEDKEISRISKEVVNHFGFYNLFKHDKEVNIVKPHGIYAIKNLENESYYPGFVIDYLDGKKIKDFENYKENGIFSSAFNQWIKVNKWGINPLELNVDNSIWVPKEEKVYLIDLSGWKFMKKRELKKFKDFFDYDQKVLEK